MCAGDLVFIPSRWWHCVLNLEPCVAITQNYISDSNLKAALFMMKYNSELVSGIPACRPRESVYSDFRNSLQVHHPELLRSVEAEVEVDLERQRMAKEKRIKSQIPWSNMKKQQKGNSFSFRFF